jgi:hypothetical protein
LGYHGSWFSLDWQFSEMEPWSVPLKLWLCKSSMKVESWLICYSAVGQIELGWVCLKRGNFHCKWHGKSISGQYLRCSSSETSYFFNSTLQQNMGAFHGSISLNCHSDEDNRMSFHMTTTTHVYCLITHDARPITCIAHLTTCDAIPLHTINENNFISNMIKVLLDL